MKRLLPWTIALLLGVAAPSWSDPIWIEDGDAGDLLNTAQNPLGDGALSTIFGNLSNPDPFESAFDIDLFMLFIFDPLSFSASTVDAPGINVSDPQLFLFDSTGHGVYMNDDDESGLNGAQSSLPAGHSFGPTSAGIYYLAIGWFDNEPLDALASLIFDSSTLGVNGPAAGSGALSSWNSDVLNRIDLETGYEIQLTGVQFTPVPEPGTLVLLAAGLVGVISRRRQPRTRSRCSDAPGPAVLDTRRV